MSDDTSRIGPIFRERWPIDEALHRAVRKALLARKREGLPVVIWREGQPVWVSVEELGIEEDSSVSPE